MYTTLIPYQGVQSPSYFPAVSESWNIGIFKHSRLVVPPNTISFFLVSLILFIFSWETDQKYLLCDTC